MTGQVAGRERELVEVDAAAREHAPRHDHHERIQVRSDQHRGASTRMDVVSEPPCAGTDDKHPSRIGRAERRVDHPECRLVLFGAPAPVAVQVGVVARQPLPCRQRRNERPICFSGRQRLGRIERRQQRSQAPGMIAAGARQQLETIAGRRTTRRFLERRTVSRGLHLEFRRELAQAHQPFSACRLGLGEEPRDAIDQRIACTAGAADNCRTWLERSRAARAAQQFPQSGVRRGVHVAGC